MSDNAMGSPKSGDADIAVVAGLLADRSRADMLTALSDGRALPAGELAHIAGVAPSTASSHLNRLVASGFVAVETWGKHRYYRLARPELAMAMEALAIVSPAKPIRSLRQAQQSEEIRFARTCYDHLGGRVGVALTRALVDQGFIADVETGYSVTESGAQCLRDLGADVDRLKRQLSFSPYHIDWSERYRHIAGPLAKAMTMRMFELGWLRHVNASRAVRITDVGREGCRERFGLDVERINPGDRASPGLPAR